MKKVFIALIAVVALMTSCTVVDNSEIGIKFKKFGLTDQGELKALPCTGWVMYNPFTTSVYTYSVYYQDVDYPAFLINSSDGSEFKMDPKLIYKINRDMAIKIFTNYRRPLNEIEENYLKTYIEDAYRITANKYTADSLMANRGNFEGEVEFLLKNTLDEEGFSIKEFTSQIIPPASLQKKIDAKNEAFQEALQTENLIRKANADAQINIAEARGKAEALRIQADGEAYYNSTVAASITDLLVKQDAIEKWDGKMPVYTGSGAVPFIDLK